MVVKIKRIDKGLPLPKFETSGAVGFDLLARVGKVVKPKEIVLIPANNIIEVPDGFALILAPRSSMPSKTGLCFPHSIGLLDQDYCGEEDEVQIQVQNLTDQEVVIKRGDRIAQGMFVKIEKADWEETDSMEHNKTRGGFGSTGESITEKAID